MMTNFWISPIIGDFTITLISHGPGMYFQGADLLRCSAFANKDLKNISGSISAKLALWMISISFFIEQTVRFRIDLLRAKASKTVNYFSAVVNFFNRFSDDRRAIRSGVGRCSFRQSRVRVTDASEPARVRRKDEGRRN